MVNDTPRTPDHQQDDSTPHDGDPSTVVDGIDEFGTSVLEETSWGDRVDKAKKISTGLNRFNAGECPSNDDPGKFALIQEPTVIRKKDDHKLGYQVVLPKGYYGTMIVDEGPHPGAVISSVYEYHDLDPDLDRPEDLFGKTIPVREVVDDSETGSRWVLDLPGRSQRLYEIRRTLQDQGYVTWGDESLPIHRRIKDEEPVAVPRKLYDKFRLTDIGTLMQTTPSLSTLPTVATFGPLLALVAIGLYIGQLPLAAGALVAAVLIHVALGLLFALSRKSVEEAYVPET